MSNLRQIGASEFKIVSCDSQLQQDDLEAQFIQGFELHQKGQLAQAKAIYEQLLATLPSHFDALHLLGVVAHQNNDFMLAVELIDKALEIVPHHATAHFHRGNALKKLLQLEEAVLSYGRAISINPNFVEAYYNCGLTLQGLKRLEESLASFDGAIAIKPDFAEAYSDRGNTLKDLNRLEEAISSYDRAIAIKPDFAAAHYNSGNVFHELNRIEEAIICYDRAISIKPDYVQAHLHKSLALLLAGEFKLGWKLYEWRWKLEPFTSSMRNFPRPCWLGAEDISGKTVLLYAEQGFGDTIQFCRYVKLVKALGASTVLEVPKALAGLLNGLEGVDTVIEEGQSLPMFDFHCPLLSLPLALRTEVHSIPSPTPYLSLASGTTRAWARKLGEKKALRVGLAWSGRATHKNDGKRTLTLAELLPYLPEEYEYFSLQNEVRPADNPLLNMSGIRNYGEELKDFADTAAICSLMDLVISVDTSVAHLAGAIGKTTWVLLPYAPDWRWLLNRNDCPWYDSVRLYRQPDDMRWDAVLEQVAYDLMQLSNQMFRLTHK